jgi:hypothetical protein
MSNEDVNRALREATGRVEIENDLRAGSSDEETAAFRAWSDKLDEADDDLARDLAAIGRERDWVTKDGKIVPPGKPSGDMSREIRRATGRP